ncbi:uncharacterized protein LOC131841090 [Achroia grisella]|uniref:uncharacterized protein LOC131841090 n=1 Tax=Achroia grisella TaxID=688607 RepID=UPI0027D2BDF0|nr:uncharacterized protein LOC131841090 [Achroia grisella]
MSWKNVFSHQFSPVVKCTVIGCLTTIISLVLITMSIVYLSGEEHKKIELLQKILKSSMNKTWLDFLTVMTIIVSSLWMIFSGSLIIGVLKNYIGFVLSYFVYGIFVVIAFNLCALLLLLHQHWIIAVTEIILSLVYIRALVTIYNVYDLMQRGKIINNNKQNLLEDSI